VRAAPVALPAAAIAQLVGGRLEGDASLMVHAVGPLERDHGGALSFLSSAQYLEAFRASQAGCVLVPESLPLPAGGPATRIRVADPAAAMAVAVAALYPPEPPEPGIDPTARLGRGARLAAGVSVGPFAVIGAGTLLGARTRVGAGAVLDPGVETGEDCDIGPRVCCATGTRLGNRVRIKAGAVIGGSGFGFVPAPGGGHREIPHVGGCVLGDDVSVGANSCIDRGSVGDTMIGPGTKLDNHVHIGHNARLGARCLVMGGVVVAGSARIGSDVVLAGHSAVGGHFRVGDRVRVGAKAGVISAVADGTDVSGFPARPHREFLRAQAALYRLAPLVAELEALAARQRDHA
jgi:UDP-3-O-[3-hydroxymyristoyl] glucosamine N-acyltransferase